MIVSHSLIVNQKVIAYEGHKQWVGTVCYDDVCPADMKWYINIGEHN